jgi:hypothetical protein
MVACVPRTARSAHGIKRRTDLRPRTQASHASPPFHHGCKLKEDCAASTGFMVNTPKLLPEKQAEQIRHERNAAGKQKLERAANPSCQKAPAILANRAIA